MKRRVISCIVPLALTALMAPLAAAKDISFNDLPAAAKREAETELKSGTLKRVESVKHQGQTIYALTFQRADGSPKYIYLNADGTYVKDPAVAHAVPSSSAPNPAVEVGSSTNRDMSLKQLPEAVQRTIQTEIKNGPVTRITQKPQRSGVIYEVFFRQANGQPKTIYLNPDGSYVQGKGAASGTGRSWDALSGKSGTSTNK